MKYWERGPRNEVTSSAAEASGPVVHETGHLPGGDLCDEASLTPLMRLSIATLSLCSMSLTRLRRG